MNEMNQRNGSDVALGLLVGTVIGVGIGLLFAPSTGEETRRRLGDTARRLRHDGADKLGKIADRARGAFNDLKQNVREGTDEARARINEMTPDEPERQPGPGSWPTTSR